MKAITIWQPWATLIVAGAKPYEFRSWHAPNRLIGQRLAIHAGARPMRVAEIDALLLALGSSQCAGQPRRHSGLIAEIAVPILQNARSKLSASLPLSSVLGSATLGQPTKNPVVEGYHLVADSDRTDHLNWGWPLTDIERFEPPLPARGAQGLWNWTP